MKLYILPFGGLGNRLRVLNSAKEIQSQIYSDVYLVWLIKSELNVSLNKLFSSVGFQFHNVKGLPLFIFLKFFKHSYIQKYDKVYRFIASLYFDAVIFDKDVLSNSRQDLLATISKNKRVLVATCYEFFDFKDFNNYQLQDEIQAKVNAITEEFAPFTFGVHIRRTDHKDIMTESPLSLYYEKIAELCKEKQDARFFLATDDSQVKSELQAIYKDRIIVQETPLTRSSESGMIGAVVDIYCLAATQLIICNTNSSFAKMASLIGNSKKIVEVR